jgi:DnaJ-class molecular chaperone
MRAKPKPPTLYCDDDSEIELPFRWAICPACDGHATDRGASVECDGGGFTSSEWAEQDEDFKEGYLRGDYDRPCDECDGSGKVMEADYSRMTPEQIKEYDEQIEGDRECEAIHAAERRMGA